MRSLHPLDIVVLLAYVGVVVAIGVITQRRQHGRDDFFLGGRSLPWPLVGVSILATAFSATSLLGGPGEAFSHGLLWLQLQLGDLLGVALVVLLLVPALRGKNLTTAYEFLAHRFDGRVRVLASVLFQLQVVLRAGVLVYGPALALATLTGWPLAGTIVGVGILATLYTVLGGITAVVWTDALQLVVIAAGLIGCVVTVAADLAGAGLGGLGHALGVAAEAGRAQVVDLEQPLTSPRSLPGAVLGYGLLALAVSGTNQQTVQRYLSCRSVAEARRAAWLGWAVGLGVTAATLFVGMALYGFYHGGAFDLPADIAADAVLPHFVATRLAPGVAGLLVAAILAAAMSSLDSALSSLATATSVDLLGPAGSDRAELRRARAITLAWGAVAIAAALLLAGRGTLLALGVRVMGWFAGPVLALFLLALLPRPPRPGAALLGGAVGFAAVVFLTVPGPWPAPGDPGIWTTAVGAAATAVLALVADRAGRSRPFGNDPG
jgi:SSS family solute:Na+ symporter